MILAKNLAPQKILYSFVQLIEDPDERESVANKHNVALAVIDSLVAKKDRLGLMRYMTRLTENSEEYCYAHKELNVSNVRWKN